MSSDVSTNRPVLVTGGFGNVGRHTVRTLLADRRRVVATDLRTPAAEAARRALGDQPGLEVVWTDLTDPEAGHALVAAHRPSAVIHLAAVIPPLAYARPHVAEAVNVHATRHLVSAVESLDDGCRFVLASSIGVHGSRNPHTMDELTASTPVRPVDVYGAGKAAGEATVTGSALEWVVLRLGAVIFPEVELAMDPDAVFMEAMLPVDGRVHTVDVRDVARALVNATTASCAGEFLLIAGDDSHRMRQGELSRAMAAAIGLRFGLPPGRPGDPGDDDAWFVVDWMDTRRAQEVLQFQRHPWPETLAAIRAYVGAKRHLLPLVAPLARGYLTLRSPHRGAGSRYTDLWPGVVRRWGEAATTTAIRNG